MKKILFCLFCLVFTLACSVPGSQVLDAQNGDETQNTPEAALAPENTPLPAEINAPIVEAPSIISIEMLDEIYGWAVTETQIVRTNDGGVTWYNVTPAGLVEMGYSVFMDFLDVQHAWIQVPDPNNFPFGGTMYRTSDGGLTWTSSMTPFSGGDISFVDANNGWMMADLGVGAGSMAISVFQTNDGGATWTRTYTNDPNIDGAGDTLPRSGIKQFIAPISMNTAWIGGVVYAPGSVYLFRTDDGGKTWFHINLPLSEEAKSSDLGIFEVKFVSLSQGFVSLHVMSTDGYKTLIYATEDGGNTWTQAPAELAVTGILDIVSAQEMVLYSSNQFYVTRDAAKTWSIVAPDVAFGDFVSSMSFANSNTGWVITTDLANHHSLYKTTDGGSTWFPIIP
jgi:photosystem II stability/assembly factor-like uncharacterized protein